jgi:hypothetical protein
MKFLKAFYYLLISRKIILINSPLQLINFQEFCFINEDFKNYDKKIFVGYTNSSSIKKIKKTKSSLKLKYKIIFLNKVINVRIVHFIIKVRKILFFRFEECLIGDINYYLHREFYKLSKKKYIVDDGTSSLNIKKLTNNLNKSNTTLFTVYETIKIKKIKIIQNNYNFLKTIFLNKKPNSKKEIHFISSMLNQQTKYPNIYYGVLRNLKRIHPKYKFIYIGHINENLKLIKKELNCRIIKHSLPIELYYCLNHVLPKKIIFNYSSALFVVNKLFKDYKNTFNIGIKNKSYLQNIENRLCYVKADNEIRFLKIRNKMLM